MASVVLGVVGSSFGGPIGGAIGSLIGSFIDQTIVGWLTPTQKVEGPRLTDTQIQTSTEGAIIPRVYGYTRLAGQVIWASQFLEAATTKKTGGGKGSGGSSKTTTYSYSISFAVALCEGEISSIGRCWANGSALDLTTLTMRVYKGTETQDPDTLIEEIEGTGNTPAYRGAAYVVFEDFDLTDYGNQIPTITFEVIRSLGATATDETAVENLAKSVTLIPGAGEFAYSTTIIKRKLNGETTPENQNSNDSDADSVSSLDDLQATMPNVESISLVVGWYGTDLRCGECEVKPKVENSTKKTTPNSWRVSGLERSDADVVSVYDDLAAYGGTPSDLSVYEMITELKNRGLRVTFYPFIFMDIADDNALPDPYSDNAATLGQAAYPWRGRITCSPSSGYAGTVDKTATAATQVSSFVGSTSGSDFQSWDGDTIDYDGPEEWSYRRFILHYAKLCAAAGGVDAFLIGSEMVALTRVRSDATSFPFVTALKTLATDVAAILPSAKIGYSADWSDYNTYRPSDGSGDVLFHLDPLWSDSNIDFVGIDNYMKLSDWRDGTSHLDYDAANGPTRIYDLEYLRSNIETGEDFDWYYVDDSDRDDQVRTTISDGGYGEPWVYRQKAIRDWWENRHYNRPGGVRSVTATDWVPESKPIWFTELGCPAIDKGSNQPNVFIDEKSSESAAPCYSSGERDDLIQRRFIEAHLTYWDDTDVNPVSSVYGDSMLDLDNVSIWTWDARPFPFFPGLTGVWGDFGNYQYGHWLTGRAAAVPLELLVADICDYHGFADYDVSDLYGLVTGYTINTASSARAALEPLMAALHFDAVESQGVVKFIMRGRPDRTAISADDAVMGDGADYGIRLTRAAENSLPVAFRVTYLEAGSDYRQASYEAQRFPGESSRLIDQALPMVIDQGQAASIGDRLLQQAWLAREGVSMTLPPSLVALDPGDEVALTFKGRTTTYRLTSTNFGTGIAIEGSGTDGGIYEPFRGPSRELGSLGSISRNGQVEMIFAELPTLNTSGNPWQPYMAAYTSPWPESVLVYRSPSNSGFELDTTITEASSIGVTTTALYSGPEGVWDNANEVTVLLYSGTLESVDEISVLGGSNVIAVENADGEWEVLQFVTATLVSSKTWTLSRLLRAQLGTESAMRDPVAAGARVIVLDSTLTQPDIPLSQYALPFYFSYGPSTASLSSDDFVTEQLQFEGVGLRPYSPVHIEGTKDGSGDITISWIRRDRIGADSWDLTEVPMSETEEVYEVDILDGSDVVRTLTASTASVVYSAASQIADFGSAPSSLTVSVSQVSSYVGRGTAREALIHV